MNKDDVIAALGEPARILPRDARGMVSTAWFCLGCRKLHTFAHPVRPPAPCECGGIAFEKRSAVQPIPGVSEVKLRDDPRIWKPMEYARWDAEDALKERHPEVRHGQRTRVRMYVKLARIRLHDLMRQERLARLSLP